MIVKKIFCFTNLGYSFLFSVIFFCGCFISWPLPTSIDSLYVRVLSPSCAAQEWMINCALLCFALILSAHKGFLLLSLSLPLLFMDTLLGGCSSTLQSLYIHGNAYSHILFQLHHTLLGIKGHHHPAFSSLQNLFILIAVAVRAGWECFQHFLFNQQNESCTFSYGLRFVFQLLFLHSPLSFLAAPCMNLFLVL